MSRINTPLRVVSVLLFVGGALLPLSAAAQDRLLAEPALQEVVVREPAPVEPAFPAAPDTPLPADSEFETAPSSALLDYRAEGEVFTPAEPPDVDPRCPLPGSFYDGANCFVAETPDGLSPFIYDGKLYTTPKRTRCDTGSYDGANCYYHSFPGDYVSGFVSGKAWYYRSIGSYCQLGTRVGYWSTFPTPRALCYVGTAPASGGNAFIYGSAFYYVPGVSTSPCPVGSYDSANCYVATPPYGTQPFIWNGNLYHTPYSGPPVELWGGQSRLRGVFATIYIHGRNADGTGPIYGFGYSGWSWKQKGSQPIWLAWDGSAPLNQSINGVKTNLDTACQGPDLPCHVVCHSAGCLMVTRLLAENPDRWNIASVTSMAGAQGGSEIADIGAAVPWYIQDLAAYFDVLHPIDADLTTNAARSMYDHNQTGGVPVITTSGNWDPLEYADGCSWWMWVIASPYCVGVEAWNNVVSLVNGFMNAIYGGGHDGVLAYHSSAGFRQKVGSWNTCSSVGYWTNYDSIHRRGHCYEGTEGVFHSDTHVQLEAFGTIPP